MLEGKTVLINGGTGSFGNTVLSDLMHRGAKEIRIFSRDEKKQEDMRKHYNNPMIKFFIGDVREYSSVENAVRGSDFIFHAAALKQVPSCEFYPMEAVRTNILGTENVLEAAIKNGVQRIVVLSTDKAVYPINAMGISKAMMEKVTIAKARMMGDKGPVMAVTRYGNVMASRGSVIPLFVSQIKAKQPITVTDPTMTRFLMSLPQSVDLVRFAYENANQGDTFVQKAPASTIETLYLALMEIFDRKVEVRTIGTRHGEKKHESLISREEMSAAEDMGLYFRVPCDGRDLNYDKYFVSGDATHSQLSDYTSETTEQLDVQGTIDLLMNLDYIRDELATGPERRASANALRS